MRRVRLFSWQLYTHQNYGDAILAEAIRYLFHSFGQRQYFRIEDGADNRYMLGPRMIEYANGFDAGIIAGGGLIIPRNLTTSGWAFNSTVENARKLRRTIVFALGFNLYRRHTSLPPIFKEHFESILENAPFVGLRNHTSIEKLKEIVDSRFHDRIVFQPCPTTFIRHLVEGYDTTSWPPLSKKVTLQVTFEAEVDKDRFAEQVLRACQALVAQGYEVEIASFFAKFDMPMVEYLREHEFDDFTFVEMNTEGRDLLKGPTHFSSVPIVISSRGHGAMVPFGAGSAVIPMNMAPKVEYFAKEVGLSEHVLDVDDPDLATSMVRAVERYTSDYESIQQQLQNHRQRFYEVSLDNLSRIYFDLTGDMTAERNCLPLNEFEVFLSSRLHSKCVKLEGVTRGKRPDG